LQEIVFANTDGVLGPRTLREIETHLGYEPDIKLILRRYAHYTDLAERHEWARNYLLGWCRRTKALWEEVR
jgi:lysozyme family protein